MNNVNCMQVVDDAAEAGESLKTTYIFTGGYARSKSRSACCFDLEEWLQLQNSGGGASV